MIFYDSLGKLFCIYIYIPNGTQEQKEDTV